MKKTKQVLQGIDNFKQIIDSNGYYVDKTLFIKDLIDRPDKVVLITRPRRFGKTLNMSMLKYFFEIPKCRESHLEDVDVSYLFEDLNIFKDEKYKSYQGIYPVVYLTFKDAKQTKWEETYQNIKKIIANEYRRHQYILNSDVLDEKEKENYSKIIDLTADDTIYTDVVISLSDYLKRYFKKECIVLIDEYDTPIQAGYLEGYFKEVINFFKSMLVKGFKDNNALKQGVLTGIMKVAQESIFSDFNNPVVATILSERFKDKFGFTEEEVEKMAKYLNLEGEISDVKAWYNGYIFGLDTVIYNPWSIIKFMASPIEGLKPYWINTSDNRIIKDVMQLDKKEGKEVVEKLIKGEEVRKVLEENVVYQNIKTNPNVAWSFLLHAGYLKASDRAKERNRFAYKLEIPNIEVKTVYEEMITNYFEDDEKISNEIDGLIKSLEKGDLEKFGRILGEFYMGRVSFYDVSQKKVYDKDITETEQEYRHENFHHGFMLGLLMYAVGKFEVHSNKEYGLGRPDIVLIPQNKENTAYVFEFKWDGTRGKKTLDDLVELAKKQVEEKKYIDGVKKAHNVQEVVSICVGFKGKDINIQFGAL